jgi:AmiR/NasT family two-component response regulator
VGKADGRASSSPLSDLPVRYADRGVVGRGRYLSSLRAAAARSPPATQARWRSGQNDRAAAHCTAGANSSSGGEEAMSSAPPHPVKESDPQHRAAVAPITGGTDHLRVLIANERKDRLALVAPIVVALGHEVIAREIDVEDVGPLTARERPDVALVGLGASSKHALDLIDKIVRQAACPVIVLLHAPDPAFVKEASKRGVFAHISDDDVEEWQSSIDIVLRRFAEFHELQGAFGRRALTERAKGILMERHSIDEDRAFEMLRERSRTDNRKLIDLAAAVVDGHRLLPKQPQGTPQP